MFGCCSLTVGTRYVNSEMFRSHPSLVEWSLVNISQFYYISPDLFPTAAKLMDFPSFPLLRTVYYVVPHGGGGGGGVGGWDPEFYEIQGLKVGVNPYGGERGADYTRKLKNRD